MKLRRKPTLALALSCIVSFPVDTLSLLAAHQRIATKLHSHLWVTKNHDRAQIRLDDGEIIDVISRSVKVKDDWFVTIWEKYQPAATVDHYWNTQSRSVKALDPFGLVNWPGSIVASQELLRYKDEIENTTVLVIGAGTGVEAQAVAMLKAKKVIATDYNPTTLKLLEYGVSNAGLENVVTTQLFDLFSTDPLPDCDVLIAADVMYSERLSSIISDRCREARQKTHPPKILVSDSQRFADFVPQLRIQLGDDSIEWEYRGLDSFTGSGVMIDDDQTYDVKARVLAIGWTRHSVGA
jgi:predicted nicotinamide N-methyase